MALCSPDEPLAPLADAAPLETPDALALLRHHIGQVLTLENQHAANSLAVLQGFYASQARALAVTLGLAPPPTLPPEASENIPALAAEELAPEAETALAAEEVVPDAEPAPALAAEELAPEAEAAPTLAAEELAPEAEAAPTLAAEELAPDAEPAPTLAAEELAPEAEPAPALAAEELAPDAEPAPTLAAEELAPEAEAAPTLAAEELAPEAEPAPALAAEELAPEVEAAPTLAAEEVAPDAEPAPISLAFGPLQADEPAEMMPFSVLERAAVGVSEVVGASLVSFRGDFAAGLLPTEGEITLSFSQDPPSSLPSAGDIAVAGQRLWGCEDLSWSEGAAGLFWAKRPAEVVLDTAETPAASQKFSFSEKDLMALRMGDVGTFLGKGFETLTHRQTPRYGRMPFTSAFLWEATGGRWKRGLLCLEGARADCSSPAQVMAGVWAALALAMTARGMTHELDGWHFVPAPCAETRWSCASMLWEPAPDESLHYQVHLSGWSSDVDSRTAYADVLCWRAGELVVIAQKAALSLRRAAVEETQAIAPVSSDPQAASLYGIPQDSAALLAAACGPMADFAGEVGARYDALGLKAPRLPAPPLLFLSRVVQADLTPHGINSRCAVEADLALSRWCSEDDTFGAGRLVALVETLVQAARHTMAALDLAIRSPVDLCARLLSCELTPVALVDLNGPPLHVAVRALGVSRMGETTMIEADVQASQNEQALIRGRAILGFLPAQRVESEPVSASSAKEIPQDDKKPVTVSTHGGLLPLERLSEANPQGGPHCLGRYRAEVVMSPDHWIFAKNVLHDPVLPESITLGCLGQLLHCAANDLGVADGMDHPHVAFAPVGQTITGQFRGHITPQTQRVSFAIDITDRSESEGSGRSVVANGTVWADGVPIYHLQGLGLTVSGNQFS